MKFMKYGLTSLLTSKQVRSIAVEPSHHMKDLLIDQGGV